MRALRHAQVRMRHTQNAVANGHVERVGRSQFELDRDAVHFADDGRKKRILAYNTVMLSQSSNDTLPAEELPLVTHLTYTIQTH